MAVIEIKDLAVRFNSQLLLEDLSLLLQRGQKAVITGPSGAGKSTLLRCLLGFVLPTHGEINIDGLSLDRRTVWQLRTKIAYVAQEPDLGMGSVREILAQPFNYRANQPLRANLTRVPEMFERFLLSTELMDQDISTLSGGQKQRVALISALLLERDILLLDEITSALDEKCTRAVTGYLQSHSNLTAVIVAHNWSGFTFTDFVIELPGGTRLKG